MSALLSVQNLRTFFSTPRGTLRAVDGIDFEIPLGGTLGVVGESGSGKSVTALSVMRLVDRRPAGSIDGRRSSSTARTCRSSTSRRCEKIRGNEISMIFQEPMTSLNPVFTVGDQIAEAVMLHQQVSQARGARPGDRDARGSSASPSPERRVRRLSAPVVRRHASAGDDRDGAVLQPEAADRGRADDGSRRDHPGPDPRADARAAASDSGMSILLITHDLGVVAEMADEVAVMYAGRVVERGPVARRSSARPQHPYTRGAAAVDPAARDALHDAAEGDPRDGPEPARLAGRLPVRAALRLLLRPLRDRGSRLIRVGAQESACLLCEGGAARFSRSVRPRERRRSESGRRARDAALTSVAGRGTLLEARGVREVLPRQEGDAETHGRPAPGGRRRRPGRSTRARRSASSASPAAASRRSGARCCGCSSRRRARSASTASTSWPQGRDAEGRCAATCRSSSRTRSARSTRG